MIEKILERLEKRKDRWTDLANQSNFDGYAQEEKEYLLMANEDEKLIEIVQEVAKEYDWIPVDQKMPEDFTNVYATCISLVDDRKPWVIEGVYHSLTGWEEMTPYLSWGKAKVIAWMPKKRPAPYQKGE